MERARGRFCPCSKFVSKMPVAVVLAEGKHHCPWEAASVHSIPCECKAMMPYTCAATSRGCTQALLRFIRANQGVQSPVLTGCSSWCTLLPCGLSTNHPCGCTGLSQAEGGCLQQQGRDSPWSSCGYFQGITNHFCASINLTALNLAVQTAACLLPNTGLAGAVPYFGACRGTDGCWARKQLLGPMQPSQDFASPAFPHPKQ